jgi:hypothetical protein
MAMFFAVMLFAKSAMAVGLGAYGTGGVNISSWTYASGGSKESFKTNDFIYGGGLVIDSAVAKDMLFNYRFTAGYEQYVSQDKSSGYLSDPIHRVSMSHTFGFGVLRNQNLRLWIGPRIGMHYLRFRSYYTGYLLFLSGDIIFFRDKREIDALGVDLLFALGLNINIGDYTTVFFDIGCGLIANFNLRGNEDATGFGTEAKIGVMFRVSDTYVASAVPAEKQ